MKLVFELKHKNQCRDHDRKQYSNSSQPAGGPQLTSQATLERIYAAT